MIYTNDYMKGLMRSILVSILTIAVLAYFMPNVSYASSVTLIVAAIVLTLLEKIVRPILKILFLPINIVTLGFFGLVINVFILYLATYLVPGFMIAPAVIFGIELNQFFTLLFVSALIGFLQGAFALIL